MSVPSPTTLNVTVAVSASPKVSGSPTCWSTTWHESPARRHGLTKFTDKLGEWVSKCQSWDGGISAAPGNEAHGAYAFCGLGCLSILGAPKETMHTYLNISLLVNWMSSRTWALYPCSRARQEGWPEGQTWKARRRLSHLLQLGWVERCPALLRIRRKHQQRSRSRWFRCSVPLEG